MSASVVLSHFHNESCICNVNLYLVKPACLIKELQNCISDESLYHYSEWSIKRILYASILKHKLLMTFFYLSIASKYALVGDINSANIFSGESHWSLWTGRSQMGLYLVNMGFFQKQEYSREPNSISDRYIHKNEQNLWTILNLSRHSSMYLWTYILGWPTHFLISVSFLTLIFGIYAWRFTYCWFYVWQHNFWNYPDW